MKNSLLKSIFMLGAFLCMGMVQAQSVSGTVSDANGPLPGANILVKGTANGTQSDFDGNYTINNLPANAILVFSYVGYKTQEIPVNGKKTVNVTLSEDAQSLDEVVIIGYGSVKQSDATGAVASVKADDLNKGVTASPNQLIQGKVSGLQVTTSSGQPGASSTIRIRGNSSIRSGNDPLIVVDGIPLNGGDVSAGANLGNIGNSGTTNPLNFINSNDIASMDVLKDASATAIYGSRGANGVILITTKKGKAGKLKIDANSSLSFAKISNKINLYNAEQFAALAPDQDQGGSADAFDAILRTAQTVQNDVSISGGTEKLSYRMSLSMLEQEGIIKNSALDKYTAAVNTVSKFFDNDRLTVNFSLLTSSINDKNAPISSDAGFEGSLIGSALNWNPTRDLYNADGTLNQYSTTETNPLALLEYTYDRTRTLRTLGSISANFRIVDGLFYKLNFGIDNSTSTRSASISNQLLRQGISPDNSGTNGLATVTDLYKTSKLVEHTLNYSKAFSNDFNFDALVGYSYQTFDTEGKNITASDFGTNAVNYIYQLGSAAQASRGISSYKLATAELQSYFGRVNFNFYNKYLITGTLRADGSNKFGQNNKYGYFPSVAVAWKLSEEDFIPEFFNQLKLRVGYGQTGNQEFPSGAAQELYIPGLDGSFSQTGNSNPDLKWETSTTTNFGIDFGILNGRLRGTFEYFHKNTEDLLFFAPLAAPNNGGSIWTNLNANVINSGFEASLTGVIINKKDFNWEVGINASFLKNELQNFDGIIETGFLSGQGVTGTNVQRFVGGQPLHTFYTLRFLGLDDQGLGLYSDSKEYLGDPNPDILLGITSNFSYKNLDATIALNGAYGHQLYNNTGTSVLVASNPSKGRNTSPDYTLPNENSANAIKGSSRYIESGDFLRLANLTVGYSFDNVADWISRLRVFATGQNLFVITPFSGFDPEVNVNKQVNGVPSFGIEYTPYPASRNFTLGLNVSF
ncbi:SusC/RagA family TonB-linked outer membrane protein [Zhouia sp. PK063]|uniref:SusC/RagA family TonB-linked outer membrane protein n=1 Tax=Zhouia sp. PK063 TaxID=3373602 RepID=UPI0037B07351